ncbi:MAG: serine hydrolase [Pseudonocardiaceae bacterium]
MTESAVLSVYVAGMDSAPFRVVNPDVRHDAASTIKAAVLAALYRSGVDLDASVPVIDSFPSAVPETIFSNSIEMDSDPEPWRRVGGRATLRWLANRMITRSSNLATNVCLHHVGLGAVAQVWRSVGATHSGTDRLIEDYAAKNAGIVNLVTAADLARLFRWLGPNELDLLALNEHRVDLAAGLPVGTRIAFKNGWFPGLRHSAGIVYPADAEPYVIVVCYTGPLATGDACHDPAAALLARISAEIWAQRHALATWADGR